MKKTVICLLAAIIMVTIPLGVTISAADQPISVVMDGTELSFDAQPRIVDGRTLVPLRGIFEAMGATVLWNGTAQTITALRLDSVVKLAIGAKEATVDKVKQQLDVPAQIYEGRTFVPLRFISESMGATVNWDGATRTVTIDTDKAHQSDPGDNLNTNLLFTSEWVSLQTGEKMTFDPEEFIEINDTWDVKPDGLFYSYSETNDEKINYVSMFLDGGHLKDHYLKFDAESRILSEYINGDVLESWHIAVEMSPAEEEDAIREAHEDVVGDFSYVDKENGLILYYPNTFAQEPVETAGKIMRFSSSVDNTALLYWVLPNTNGETEETFIKNTPAEEIKIYNNVVIGRLNDVDQETGKVTPTASFWVVEPEWIACVAISCETESQAAEWCKRMIEDTAILIDSHN